MASTIVTKNSSTASAVPVTGDLTQGELAVNVTDKKLYTKDSGGTVVKLVGGLGNQEANAVAITGGSINGTTVGATTASTGAFTTLSASSTTTLSGGTANGVAYLNGSKVVTTGSALTFDGTNALSLGSGGSASTATSLTLNATDNAANGSYIIGKRNGTNAWLIGDTASSLGTGTGFTSYNYGTAPWIWYLQTGGEQMRLTSTGLGIGTSSPVSKLNVVGDQLIVANGSGTSQLGIQVKGLALSSLPAAQVQGYIATSDSTIGVAGDLLIAPRTDVATSIRFITGTTPTERMRLDSSGNLGLGVTPSGWQSDSRALDIGAYTSFSNVLGYQAVVANNAYYNSGYKYRTSGYVASAFVQASGGFSWLTTSTSGTAGNAISFTQAMTLDASGNLGIGVTGPSGKLQVNNPNIGQLVIAYNGTSVNYYDADTQIFRNGGATERARIDSSGNLLVGTTNPDIILSSSAVGCTMRGPIGMITANRSGDSSAAFGRITNTGNIVEFYYNGVVRGGISTNGTNISYNTSSDYRLKDNPQPLTGSGAFIDALQPKTWDWKVDGSKGVGFLAHEAQAVSPASVTGEKDAVDEEGKPVMQAMEYGSAEFIANIIAELQSLRARVAQLEGQ